MNVVAVIDYGMGNLRSVSKALEHVAGGVAVKVTYDPDLIRRADRVVFPGVGALRDCMAELARLGLDEVIRECAATKPFLGICLGMQALLEFSEENNGVEGLGILPGRVVGFPVPFIDAAKDVRLKVPHMGWNEVRQTLVHPLWSDIPQDSRFYFVHSYYAVPAVAEQVAGRVHYGRDITVALAKDNIFAVQFHPEKSQQSGLQLLANFIRWNGTL